MLSLVGGEKQRDWGVMGGLQEVLTEQVVWG